MSRKYGLRGYIEGLRTLDQLVDVDKPVDVELEMAAIARLCYESGAPAPLFHHIQGVDPGFRAVSALVGASSDRGRELERIGLSLFLPEGSSPKDIVEELYRARSRDGVSPNIVADAPCKQNVLLGDDIDLTRLPAPLLSHEDGGRYLNTMGIVITPSPDGSWTNWSIARVKLENSRTGVGAVIPPQHIGMMQDLWRDTGRQMPVAIALGVDPALLYAAATPMPYGMSEVEFAGSLLNRPVDLVRCETSGLAVPADAELVLEARSSNEDVGNEGPYGQFTGYSYPDYGLPQPMFYFDAVTYRDDAIYPFMSGGIPPSEEHTIGGPATAAEVLYQLRASGLPIDTAWSPFASCNGWLAVAVGADWAEVEPDAKAFCRRVGEAVWSHKSGDQINSVIVTENDIDPSDTDQLVWALDTRNDRSAGGRLRIEDRLGWPMSPYLTPNHFAFYEGWKSSRLIYDCLPSPSSWPAVRRDFDHSFPPEVRQKVLREWTSYGFQPVSSRTE